MREWCPAISTAKEAYMFLNNIGNYVDLASFFRPCTKSNSEPCHLVNQLETWNFFLHDVEMQLEEVAPETLGVAPRHRTSDSPVEECHNLDGWLLLCWLFNEHHCIVQIRLPRCNRCPQCHVCKALWRNSGLKTVTLICDPSADQLKIVLPTVSTCTELERLSLSGLTLSEDTVVLLEVFLKKLPLLKSLEISFSSFALACNAQLLKGAFNRMSALTSLSLSVDFKPPDVGLVLQCLSPGLSTLIVDDHFLKPRGGAVFREFLEGNTVLKKLTLRQKVCKGMSELDNVFKGLLLNHNLEELHLLHFGLQNASMELLAEAVSEHSALKVLEVGFFNESWEMDGTPLAKMLGRNKSLQELIFEVGEVGCYGAFGEAVLKNSTLKKLSLNLVQPDDLAEICVYRGFLEALSCNDTIQVVTLGSIYSVLVSSFCELLRETGTERRVNFEVDMWDAEMFTEALEKCTGLLQMRYSDFGITHSKVLVPPSAFQHLAHYYRLEELDITLWEKMIEGDAVTSLVQFLASTRTLKSLRLTFFTKPLYTHALLKGILRNKSISSLYMSRWTFDEPNAYLLWQFLRNSSLNDIRLLPEDDSNFHALSQFPVRLLDNYTLLSASYQDNAQDFEFKIKEVMRRNRSTLFRAVLFVMGCKAKRYAEAFERVSRSPALVKEVQKSASESEDDARERVRWTRDYLDQHFLAVVGVVKRDVVCIGNGRLQLDRIGLDNWLHIRQYLRVADIEEQCNKLSTSHRLPKRHQSRR